jgi:hypothetical protein
LAFEIRCKGREVDIKESPRMYGVLEWPLQKRGKTLAWSWCLIVLRTDMQSIAKLSRHYYLLSAEHQASFSQSHGGEKTETASVLLRLQNHCPGTEVVCMLRIVLMSDASATGSVNNNDHFHHHHHHHHQCQPSTAYTHPHLAYLSHPASYPSKTIIHPLLIGLHQLQPCSRDMSSQSFHKFAN